MGGCGPSPQWQCWQHSPVRARSFSSSVSRGRPPPPLPPPTIFSEPCGAAPRSELSFLAARLPSGLMYTEDLPSSAAEPFTRTVTTKSPSPKPVGAGMGEMMSLGAASPCPSPSLRPPLPLSSSSSSSSSSRVHFVFSDESEQDDFVSEFSEKDDLESDVSE